MKAPVDTVKHQSVATIRVVANSGGAQQSWIFD